MRFTANPNLVAELDRSPAFRQGLMAAARPVAAEANALGHRIMPKNRGPLIRVEADEEGVKIVNHAYGSHLDEFGSINNPPYAPLRRGARAAGLRLKESDR